MYNPEFCKPLSANCLLVQVFTKFLKNVTVLRIVNFNLLKINAFSCYLWGVCVQNVNTLNTIAGKFQPAAAPGNPFVILALFYPGLP